MGITDQAIADQIVTDDVAATRDAERSAFPGALPRPIDDREPRDWRAADRAVVRWLVATALAVVAAIAIGGITRLTESGLSITEWKPVSGVLPPLTSADWSEAYQKYLQIPEAQTVHQGITLDQFKGLFWWEWAHRLIARGVGFVIAVPFFVLLLRRRIRPGLRLRLANLPLLTALQGGMGWYMVQSGLTDRTDVSAYRLVAHLGLALVIFAIAVWTASALGRSARHPGDEHAAHPASRGQRTAVDALLALTLVTILSGGFVAGLDAGHIFNTFPLMGGRVVPPGYGEIAGWRNLFENPIAVQFHHRLLAVVTACAAWAIWGAAARAAWAPRLRQRLRLAGIAALIQLALGITTLLLAVPISIAVAHQLGAVALFTAALLAAAEAREAKVPNRE